MASSSGPFAHVVVDTNLLLHFKRIDQIDWASLSLNKVRLIILPVVVRELEKHKTFHQNAKVRDRAAKVISWFSTLSDQGFDVDLTSSLAIRFHTHEPTIEFADHKLAKDLQDDTLVAGVLSLQQDEGESAAIATADFGLKLKARQRGIAVLVPPESDRLADEPDARDKELAALRKENLQLTSRIPKLSSVFTKSVEPKLTFERPVAGAAPASLVEVRRTHPKLGETQSKAEAPGMALFAAMNRVSAEAEKRYNTKLDEYFEEYDSYLERHAEWVREALGRLQLELSLRNIGTYPANNIDVTFRFPAHIAVLTKKTATRRPKAPEAPKVPTPMDYINSLGLGGREPGDYMPRNFLPEISRPNDSYVAAEGNVLRFHSARLKQTLTEDLDTVWFQFTSPDEVQSFAIEVIISADELAGEVKQTLSVIIN